ncbi:Na+/H+ antiporter subunit E [Marinisporobacter balticus]|uniref:Multisubunit sodium/proton antiporter MrpE subunit n=1 Tax=Marinisporobacter balticus TaxID=2018667 RepID=A0A4V2SAR4_9FIRM|nr:Na+/H+ antiporter subunit E [Marinisporobacter balticus]TCO72670.1 multisubunit sodium/proton antiporter MrpE subunit [Marinisporobacter balticus]
MNKMSRYIVMFALFWIILAEKMNVERIWIGLCICMGVYLFNKNLIHCNGEKTFRSPRKIYYWILYFWILIKEIVVANFQVAKIVLSPKMDISPEIVTVHSKLKTDFYRTILANSITLTPGTLTVFMKEDALTVHCLKKDYIEDVLNSKFEKILLEVEE